MIDYNAGPNSRWRLATYRSLAAARPDSNWRNCRWRARQRPSLFLGNWDAEKNQYHLSHRHQLHGRDCGYADDVLPHRIQHSGWYVDDDGVMGTVRGIVMQLPARRHGKQARGPIYYPAVEWSECDMVTAWPGDWYDDKEDAALAADRYAQKAAEQDREANRIHDMECELEDMHDGVRENRQQMKALIQGIREVGGALPESLCALVRKEIRTIREDSRRGIRRIRKLRHNLQMEL